MYSNFSHSLKCVLKLKELANIVETQGNHILSNVKKKKKKKNPGLQKRPEWIECWFVEHPRPRPRAVV